MYRYCEYLVEFFSNRLPLGALHSIKVGRPILFREWLERREDKLLRNKRASRLGTGSGYTRIT